eukprot:TRINITY_DN46848_c0_g1_i1.p1 TRINITY_DN46848_c0_g1~~TRINITY_DN46848_c0_g1_i1.p1  ORF type:complete len:295 (+),score=74.32 TRINITY_DN46848_c0_g1_i1:55-939(+)
MKRACAVAALLSCACAEQVLLAGDSWTGGGSVFVDVFKRHGDTRTIRNIGVGGSTCQGWANGGLFGNLNRLVNAVKEPDVEHVWFICGGNDALANLLLCSPQEECVDRLLEESKQNMRTILKAVHEANPKVRVSGFGYDVFPFGAIHCNLVSLGLLPDCGGKADCVNPEFLKIQSVYDAMAEEFEFFDSTNLAGALQASQGYAGASPGHPDLSRFSPSDTFAVDCIHPNKGGYDVIFEAYYDLYWKHSRKTAPVPPRNGTLRSTPDASRADTEKTSALMWQAYIAGLEASKRRH